MAKRKGKQSSKNTHQWDAGVLISDQGHALYYENGNHTVLYPDGTSHSTEEPDWRQKAEQHYQTTAKPMEDKYAKSLSNHIIRMPFDTSEWDAILYHDAEAQQKDQQEVWVALTDKVAIPWNDMKTAVDAIQKREYMTEDLDPDKSLFKYSADLILEQMRESQNKGFLLPSDEYEPASPMYTQIPTEKFHVIDKEGHIGQPVAAVTKDLNEHEIDTLFTEKSQDESLSF